MEKVRFFTGNSNKELAEEVSKYTKLPLGKITVDRFPNMETRVEVMESVRGCKVFLLQSTSPPVNENLMELLIMIDALKRASAQEVNAIIPYFGYSKQEKRKTGREPITAKLVANMLTIAGMNRLVTVDLHSAPIEGFFNVPVDNLTAVDLLAGYFREKKLEDIAVVSPDVGGTKRARDLANRLQAKLAIIDKYRPDWSKANAMNVIGKVDGMNAVIVDDFIDTGGSVAEAVKALKNHDAKKVFVCCTHGLLTPPAIERLKESEAEEVVVTNTVKIPKEKSFDRLKVLSIAPLIGEAINRINSGGSISELFNNKNGS